MSRNEIKKMLKHMYEEQGVPNIKINDKRLNKYMTIIDYDADNRVSKNELIQFLRTMLAMNLEDEDNQPYAEVVRYL